MKNWKIGEQLKGRFDRWLRDYPRATPFSAFLLALTLVSASAWSVELASERTGRAADVVRMSEIVSVLERQVASNTAYFQATSALFLSTPSVSPEFFRQFVDRLRLNYDLTGVVALGFSEAVPLKDLPAFKKKLAEPSYPSPHIDPAPTGNERIVHAITMLEPRTLSNMKFIGYNLHHEKRRSAAMDRAMRTRAMAATDPVTLVVDKDTPGLSGFLVFLPVTASNNPDQFKGFVYSAIRSTDFIRSAVKPALLSMGKIEVSDTTPEGEELIFASGETDSRAQPIEQRLAVFDQQWVVRFYPLAKQTLYPLTLVVLIGGVSFSLLLLAYILLTQRRNKDLLALVHAQAERETERAAFVRELNHRVKNSLSNVTSIISLTKRNATDMDSFADSLLERVRALAASHSLLDGAQWGPTDLKALFEAQLSSHNHAHGRILTDGPSVLISPNDALSIGLALHELLTNATRYGALSTDDGEVTLRWHIIGGEMISVLWEEHGGPPVSTPAKRGFGLNLIERALAHELGSPIAIEFPVSGLRCQFAIPLRVPKSFKLSQKGKQLS